MDKNCNDKIELTHIMADGSIKESMQGYPLPYNEKTKYAFDLILKYCSSQKSSDAAK